MEASAGEDLQEEMSLRWRLKVATDLQFLMDDVRWFQIVSEVTEKDQSVVAVRILGRATWLA